MTRAASEWVAKHDDQRVPARVKDRILDAHGNRCALTGREFRPGDAIEFDHKHALINGGEHRESNLQPVLSTAHREKTRLDVAQKSKDARIRKKHRGIQSSSHPLPGGRNSKIKFKMDGSIIDRATGAVIKPPRNTGAWK